MGLINEGWYGMFFACGIWYLADVSSVSPSSEQTAYTLRGDLELPPPAIRSFSFVSEEN